MLHSKGRVTPGRNTVDMTEEEMKVQCVWVGYERIIVMAREKEK